MARRRLSRKIKEAVRDLRRHQTKAEAILWQKLRNRKVMGKKFLRQHPIVSDYEGRERFLVPDFCCHEARLLIELDGGIHKLQKDYDELRETILQELGFKVIRFKNRLVLNNLPAVINTIKNHL